MRSAVDKLVKSLKSLVYILFHFKHLTASVIYICMHLTVNKHLITNIYNTVTDESNEAGPSTPGVVSLSNQALKSIKLNLTNLVRPTVCISQKTKQKLCLSTNF